MPACLCVGQSHPHGHKVPIRPGRGEVSRGAGACRAEPARSPAPTTSSPANWGLSREPVCPEPSQRHGPDTHRSLSKPLSPLPPAVLGPRNCHLGTRSPAPPTLPGGVTAPAHRGRWASRRTPPSSNSSPRTRTGLCSALSSVSCTDLMLSMPPTQTRSLLPATSVASTSHPRLQRDGLARGPLYSSCPVSEACGQRLTQGCPPPRCARIPAVTTPTQPHPWQPAPPASVSPSAKWDDGIPLLTPELLDGLGRTLGREVLETVEGGGFAKPRHPAAAPPPPAGFFLLCLLPPLPRSPLDFREGSFLKSPGYLPHPTPS